MLKVSLVVWMWKYGTVRVCLGSFWNKIFDSGNGTICKDFDEYFSFQVLVIVYNL